MIRWVRHRWALDGPHGEVVAEAYAECCSVADAFLQEQFDSTRELERTDRGSGPANRLMNGWVRFG